MPLSNVTVLLVDDNDVDVMGVRRAFKNAQAVNSVVVAADGVEALSLMRDGKSLPFPYLVLLDINMPKMNGLEFLQAVRRDPALRKLVVFVLSTSKSEDDRTKAFEHNIAGYIVKSRTAGNYIKVAELLDRYAALCEIS